MGLGAVVLAGLAAGLLGLAGGQALGEGGGLAPASAGRLVELAAEALVLGLQVAEASLKGLAAGAGGGLHASILGEARAAAEPPRPRSRNQLELDALNKYGRRGWREGRCFGGVPARRGAAGREVHRARRDLGREYDRPHGGCGVRRRGNGKDPRRGTRLPYLARRPRAAVGAAAAAARQVYPSS